MALSSGKLELGNEVFACFLFHAAVVLLKTVIMSLWTARYRLPRKVFVAPEDYGIGSKAPAVLPTDPDVERVRRCHLNDLENVLPFVLLGFLYVLTGPEASTAILYFRIFAGARLFHTVAYMTPLPQPSRALCFFAGVTINILMAVALLKTGTM